MSHFEVHVKNEQLDQFIKIYEERKVTFGSNVTNDVVIDGAKDLLAVHFLKNGTAVLIDYQDAPLRSGDCLQINNTNVSIKHIRIDENADDKEVTPPNTCTIKANKTPRRKNESKVSDDSSSTPKRSISKSKSVNLSQTFIELYDDLNDSPKQQLKDGSFNEQTTFFQAANDAEAEKINNTSASDFSEHNADFISSTPFVARNKTVDKTVYSDTDFEVRTPIRTYSRKNNNTTRSIGLTKNDPDTSDKKRNILQWLQQQNNASLNDSVPESLNLDDSPKLSKTLPVKRIRPLAKSKKVAFSFRINKRTASVGESLNKINANEINPSRKSINKSLAKSFEATENNSTKTSRKSESSLQSASITNASLNENKTNSSKSKATSFKDSTISKSFIFETSRTGENESTINSVRKSNRRSKSTLESSLKDFETSLVKKSIKLTPIDDSAKKLSFTASENESNTSPRKNLRRFNLSWKLTTDTSIVSEVSPNHSQINKACEESEEAVIVDETMKKSTIKRSLTKNMNESDVKTVEQSMQNDDIDLKSIRTSLRRSNLRINSSKTSLNDSKVDSLSEKNPHSPKLNSPLSSKLHLNDEGEEKVVKNDDKTFNSTRKSLRQIKSPRNSSIASKSSLNNSIIAGSPEFSTNVENSDKSDVANSSRKSSRWSKSTRNISTESQINSVSDNQELPTSNCKVDAIVKTPLKKSNSTLNDSHIKNTPTRSNNSSRYNLQRSKSNVEKPLIRVNSQNVSMRDTSIVEFKTPKSSAPISRFRKSSARKGALDKSTSVRKSSNYLTVDQPVTNTSNSPLEDFADSTKLNAIEDMSNITFRRNYSNRVASFVSLRTVEVSPIKKSSDIGSNFEENDNLSGKSGSIGNTSTKQNKNVEQQEIVSSSKKSRISKAEANKNNSSSRATLKCDPPLEQTPMSSRTSTTHENSNSIITIDSKDSIESTKCPTNLSKKKSTTPTSYVSPSKKPRYSNDPSNVITIDEAIATSTHEIQTPRKSMRIAQTFQSRSTSMAGFESLSKSPLKRNVSKNKTPVHVSPTKKTKYEEEIKTPRNNSRHNESKRRSLSCGDLTNLSVAFASKITASTPVVESVITKSKKSRDLRRKVVELKFSPRKTRGAVKREESLKSLSEMKEKSKVDSPAASQRSKKSEADSVGKNQRSKRGQVKATSEITEKNVNEKENTKRPNKNVKTMKKTYTEEADEPEPVKKVTRRNLRNEPKITEIEKEQSDQVQPGKKVTRKKIIEKDQEASEDVAVKKRAPAKTLKKIVTKKDEESAVVEDDDAEEIVDVAPVIKKSTRRNLRKKSENDGSNEEENVFEETNKVVPVKRTRRNLKNDQQMQESVKKDEQKSEANEVEPVKKVARRNVRNLKKNADENQLTIEKENLVANDKPETVGVVTRRRNVKKADQASLRETIEKENHDETDEAAAVKVSRRNLRNVKNVDNDDSTKNPPIKNNRGNRRAKAETVVKETAENLTETAELEGTTSKITRKTTKAANTTSETNTDENKPTTSRKPVKKGKVTETADESDHEVEEQPAKRKRTRAGKVVETVEEQTETLPDRRTRRNKNVTVDVPSPLPKRVQKSKKTETETKNEEIVPPRGKRNVKKTVEETAKEVSAPEKESPKIRTRAKAAKRNDEAKETKKSTATRKRPVKAPVDDESQSDSESSSLKRNNNGKHVKFE